MRYRAIGILFFCCAAFHAMAVSPPYFSANRRHVATNLNELGAKGLLTPALSNVFTSLNTLSSGTLNTALDQMHPAPYSALAETQASVGGQILSLFHRGPTMYCGCSNEWRARLEPMGDWLHEGSLGEQLGFTAVTKGVAGVIDRSVAEHWTVGGGLVWNHSDITWHEGRGSGQVNRFLAAFYTDFEMECFYSGISLYGGVDHNDVNRRIFFPSTDQTTLGTFNAFEVAGQFSAAYLFRVASFILYPYANCDFLYLLGKKFSESGGDGFDLQIRTHQSGTIRGAAGIAWQMQDANLNETVCIQPTVAFGWAMICPVGRQAYTATFDTEPIAFRAKGWNHTWQLLSVEFRLAIYIYDFALTGEYSTDMATTTLADYWAQRGNVGLGYSW